MSKSLFNLYLQKVAEGDPNYLEKLLARLSDRLIYIPVSKKSSISSSGSGTNISISVLCLKEAHRSLVPAFTSEKVLTKWCAEKGYSGESIALLGADLCAALKNNSWLVINPGSDNPVELQPFMVQKLCKIESESFVVTRDEVIGGSAEPLVESGPHGAVEVAAASQEPSAPQVEQPISEVATTTEQPAKTSEQKKKSFLSFLRSN